MLNTDFIYNMNNFIIDYLSTDSETKRIKSESIKPEKIFTWYSFSNKSSFRKWIKSVFWNEEYNGFNYIQYEDSYCDGYKLLRVYTGDNKEKSRYTDIYRYGGDIVCFFESALSKPWAYIRKKEKRNNINVHSVIDHFRYDFILTDDVKALSLRCFNPGMIIYILKDNFVYGKRYNTLIGVDKKHYEMIDRYLRYLNKDSYIYIKKKNDYNALKQEAYLIDLKNNSGRFIGNVSYPDIGPRYENAIEIKTKDEHKCGNYMYMIIGAYLSKHPEINDIKKEILEKYKDS